MNIALMLLFVFAMLPSALLSSFGFVEAVGNIKAGYLQMSPADLTVPAILLVGIAKWRELQDFCYRHSLLAKVFFLFVCWSAILYFVSGYNPAIEGKEYSIGMLRLIKFVGSLMWCPVVAIAVRSSADLKKMTYAMMVGVSIIAWIIILNADAALRAVEESQSGALVVKSALPYGGNAASVFLAAAICFLVPVLRGNLVNQLLVIGPMSVALLMTTGRAGYLGMFVGLVYLMLVWRNWKGLVSLSIVTVIGYFLSSIDSIQEAIGSLTGKGDSDVLFMSSNGRLSVYQLFFDEIAIEKIFYGSGFGIWGTGTGLPEYTMHNFFLQMWAESGLPGLALFSLLLYVLFKGEKRNRAQVGSYTVGRHAMIVCVCVASMTETYLYGGLILTLVAFASGISIGNERLTEGSGHHIPQYPRMGNRRSLFASNPSRRRVVV